jgi:hypothetical protein
MRAIAKFLEDHGVNMVFNGHEHNYQRTHPIRANANVAAGPSPNTPAVSIDTSFDGVNQTVPDGVLYLVEGAGGNRDFDGDLGPARGSGTGIDQEDSAKGTTTLIKPFTFPNGPASWLDTSLTNAEMSPVLPGAGNGPKITTLFKAKLFSFADILINNNKLTLYQISEPLSSAHSGTFGTDVNGNSVNDPIPDTLVDSTTGNLVSPPVGTPLNGPSALLDKFVVTKPDLKDQLRVQLNAPESVSPGTQFTYELTADNRSPYNLNGTQAVFNLPSGVSFVSSRDGSAVQIGNNVVVTIGRLGAGVSKDVHLAVAVSPTANRDHKVTATALVRSSTALPVQADEIHTLVKQHGLDRDRD